MGGDAAALGKASKSFPIKGNTIQKRHGIYMGKKKNQQKNHVHNVGKINKNDRW